MSWGGSLNVSSGGHVYDRTTGSWQGETQGSIGDGVDRSVSASVSTVWHDANGPTGVQFDNPGNATGREQAFGVATPVVTNGVAASAVAGGSGPGAPAVHLGTVQVSGGGAGPGSAAVVAGPLEPKRKETHTQLQVGIPGGWDHNPFWSDTSEWEERYGEPGDWLGGVVVGGVDVMWNTWRLGTHIGTEYVGPGAYHTERAVTDWVEDGKARVNGPMPAQEPVDWGR